MDDVKKCDICGTFYDGPTCKVAAKDRYFDLCNDCYNKLCDFVNPSLPNNVFEEQDAAEDQEWGTMEERMKEK